MRAQRVPYFKFSFFTFIFLSSIIIAQESRPATSPFEVLEPKNRAGFFSGTSIIPTHLGHKVSKDVLFIPTYGIEYERKINDWLLVGVDNELELQHYVIVDEENHQITRNYIYVVTGLVFIKPIKRTYIYLGAGHEFSGMQNFTVFKFGIDYAFGLGDGFDLVPILSVDKVGNLYYAFTFGLSIGKEF